MGISIRDPEVANSPRTRRLRETNMTEAIAHALAANGAANAR